MIKKAVVHLIGDLPIVVDLLASPRASDVSLMCTNLRTIDGKRPPAVDHADGLFMLPLATIRFVELPNSEVEATLRALANGHRAAAIELPAADETEPFVGSMPLEMAMTVHPAPDDEDVPDLDFDVGLEPDEDLLQRIRDV